MANPNLGQTVASAWEAIVGPDPHDQIFADYWLLNRLKNGKSFKGVDGGRLIEIPLEYALNGTVASYTDTETISTTRADVFDVSQANWKEYAGAVVQSELEDAINQGGGGKFGLLPAKLKNLSRSFDDTFNADLYGAGTANGGKVFTGLAALVSATPTTGTVQGINRATYSWFRNQQAAGTQTSAAYDNYRAALRSVYNQCSNGVAGKHPTFLVSLRDDFEGYEGLLTANERFTSKDNGDGGFANEVIKFKGAKYAYDADCTDGVCYLLNEEFLKLCYLKGRWKKMMSDVEPANQSVRVFKSVTIGNLVVTNPRMMGCVTSIT